MTKICPICGYKNRDSAEYCEKCLFNLEEASELNADARDEEGLGDSGEGLGIYCPNGHWNPPDAKFCQICGVPLQQEHSSDELLLPPEEAGIEEGHIIKTYKLVNHDNEFVIELAMHEGEVREMLVGRKSGKNIPDIDLSGIKGSELVSRKHAKFILDGNTGEIYIVDLNSTNGTFVNGQRLNPGEKVKVSKGDEILFGKTFKFTLEEI